MAIGGAEGIGISYYGNKNFFIQFSMKIVIKKFGDHRMMHQCAWPFLPLILDNAKI